MQKNVLAILSFVLVVGSNNMFGAGNDQWSTLKKVGVVIGVTSMAATGKWASDMNVEYAKEGKRPDLKMRTAKLIGAAALLLGTDLLTSDTSSTHENLAKIGALAVASLAITDTAAGIVRDIPGIGGILTDTIDEDGREEKDLSAAARVVLLYVPLSVLAVKYVQ